MVESLLVSDSSLLNEDDDLFIKPKKKHKILWLSDHPLSTSGVGVCSRVLIDGLLKTGNYSFRCLGGAIKHNDYRTVVINDDFIIKPVDGFGTKDQIRHLLITEKPDAIFIFTDPRQFIWLFEMEDEVKQVCPIVYWHVWDNDPYPAFNRVWYESVDLINCISRKTYDLVKPHFPEKTNYIPHAFPKTLYKPLDEDTIKQSKKENFGNKDSWFKALWVNRNAHRKLPSDVLISWKMFLENLEQKHGHKNAVLIMHTEPHDMEGPNLLSVAEHLGLENHVWFSTDKLDFDKMNLLHNMTDCLVNISKAEGFGLSSLISLQVGKPVIVACTGGETDKGIDPRDGSHNGVAIQPSKRLLVGSQMVPYIYEDFVDNKEVADAFMKIYEMSDEEKQSMKEKCISFADEFFSYEKMVNSWDETLLATIEKFKQNKENLQWSFSEITSVDLSNNNNAVVHQNEQQQQQPKQQEIPMPKITKIERRKIKDSK